MIFLASSDWPEVMVTFPSVMTPGSTVSLGVLMLPRTLPVCSRLTSSEAVMLPMSVPAIASLVIFQFLFVWNDLLVAWKTRDLVGLLREGRTGDLKDHVAQIEQLALRANEAAERETDEAQKLMSAGKPGSELHRGAALAYRARLEILKPVLAAMKAELDNRQK